MDEQELGTSSYVMPGAEPDESKDVEYKVVKRYLDDIAAASKFDLETRKRYARDRRVAAGKANANWAVDANLLGNYIDILVSFLYARDPDVDARPAERVGSQHDPDIQDFAKTLQIVVSKLWSRGKLKKRAKRMVRSALTTGPGWLKAVMLDTEDERAAPEVLTHINTIKDNMAKLRAQVAELSNDDADDEDVALADMEAQLTALTDQIEVVVRKELALSFIRSERIIVSLDVDDLQDYLEADWIAEEMFIPKDSVGELCPDLTREERDTANIYYQRAPRGDEADGGQSELALESDANVFVSGAEGTSGKNGAREFVKLLEVWSRNDNHVRTFIEGVRCYAKQPFQPQFASSRFYPYFLLGFYWCDGYRNPQSLTERLRKLQDEYASSRSNERLSRERSIPGVLFNRAQLNADDAKKLEKGVQQELTGVALTNPETPIGNVFMTKPIGVVPHGTFDTSPVMRDMEKISGVQEALQAGIQVAKTATEAEIQQSGFAARTSADRDEVEDLLTDLANYTAEVALQCLDLMDVQRIAGPAAFWPEELPLEAMLTMVEVDIVGGTTGRPNTVNERESWAVVLPLIRETMGQIQEAEVMGNQPMAEALIELLRETLRRMDDRIDVERFIPSMPGMMGVPGVGPGVGPGGPMMPGILPGEPMPGEEPIVTDPIPEPTLEGDPRVA